MGLELATRSRFGLGVGYFGVGFLKSVGLGVGVLVSALGSLDSLVGLGVGDLKSVGLRVGFCGVGFLNSVGLGVGALKSVGLEVGFLVTGFWKSVGLGVGFLKSVGLGVGVLKLVGFGVGTWQVHGLSWGDGTSVYVGLDVVGTSEQDGFRKLVEFEKAMKGLDGASDW